MAYDTQYDLATGGLTNEMCVNLVNTRWQKAAEYHQKFDKKLREWYNLFRCIYTGSAPSFKNVILLPLLFSACWSDVANKAAISLGGSQIVEFDPIDPDAGPAAKRSEALINQQLFDMSIMEKMIDFLMCADVYGTGILRYGWEKKQVPYRYRQNILGIEHEVETNVITFNGPDISIRDPLDFKGQPGHKTVDTMAWACDRYYADLDDLAEEAYIAQQNGEAPRFDPVAIERLRQRNMPAAADNDMTERREVWRSYSQYQALREERYAKPVELIDMIGLVPSEYAPDGVRFRLMTVANRLVSLRNVPQPYWSMRKCFRTYCPMPDMHYFHGVGKAEIVAPLANVANKLVSNRLDALDLALQPAIFASDQTELDTQNLVLWPGRIIKIHGDVGDTRIQPVQFDMTGYTMVVNELEALSRYIDMGTGVQRDTIQGMLSGDRQTAREYLGRMEQARTRLGLESKLFERQVIEPLSGDIRLLDRQYLDFPHMVSLIGSAAQFDPDTGQPLPPEQVPISLDDLNADHRIRAVGASNMLSKVMQRQDMMTALQAISSAPVMQATTNMIAFANKFWRAFEFNPKEMINQQYDPRIAQIMSALAQNKQQGGGVPQGDQLGQLMGGVGEAPSMLGPMSGMGAGLQMNQAQ